MEVFPITLALLVGSLLVSIIVALVVWRQRGVPSPVDYRAFFVMGVIMLVGSAAFLVAATVLDVSWAIGYPLLIIGVVYTALGWGHRASWGQC